jgi:hypothetical protein
VASFHDLIGLEYQWGAKPSDGSGFTDCFGLTMEARQRLGLHSFYPEFQWLYDQYDEQTISGKQIIQWLWDKGRRINQPRAGAIFRIRAERSIALAVVIPGDDALFIGPGRRVVSAALAKVARGKYFWAD